MPPKKEARHHHYIPQFYLRGFSTGSGKRCKLTVGNSKTQKFFETNPRNVGGVRDFNRVNVEGHPPDAIESALSDFETDAEQAIRAISDSLTFDGDPKVVVLNLLALLAVRSPQMRENWRQFQEQVAKQIMSLTLATKDRWERSVASMKQDGKELPHDVPYEELKRFHQSDRYTVEVPTERHIELEMHGMDTVLPYLAKRHWALLRTDEETGFFVTGDRPVVLTWKKPSKVPVMFRRSPGFGMTETELVFPLSKTLALVGDFETEGGVFKATRRAVAAMNIRMVTHAFSQFYAPKQTFPYTTIDGAVRHDRRIFEALVEARATVTKKKEPD
jgi:hypothetical protein